MVRASPNQLHRAQAAINQQAAQQASGQPQQQQPAQGLRLRRVIRMIPQSQLNQGQQPIIINARASGQNSSIPVQRLIQSIQEAGSSIQRSRILNLIRQTLPTQQQVY